MEKILTYFTPTWNREKLLPNLYKSLCDQTNKDFIWLIVDDGSTDGTKELVESWIKENKLEIDYIYKENGGKNTAIDLAHQVCKTKLINCVDSDDYLSSNSTEVILKYAPQVLEDDTSCGIVAQIAHLDGTTFGEHWVNGTKPLYFHEIEKEAGFVPETNLIFKTDIVKRFHFPKFEGEKFVTESVYYNQFMLDYKLLAIPEVFYFAEYQEVGYTSQGLKLFEKNPKGYLYALKQNASLSKRMGRTFKNRVFRSAVFYEWKRTFKLKEDYKNDYKIPFPFNLMGWVCSKTILRNYFKKRLSK